RQGAPEFHGDYISRLTGMFAASAAQIAWLCVPPGPHVPLLTEPALRAGLHVIVEKPWLCSAQQTSALQKIAERNNLKIGVHFEYCLLSEVERWRAEYQQSPNLTFGGSFKLGRPDHLGLTPMQNLGTHLLAIHAYAVPLSNISTVNCEYGLHEERKVWLERNGSRLAAIDLLGSKEPIVQRFVTRFESSVNNCSSFTFDLAFAARVAADAAKLSNWRDKAETA
nr:Gfo/Idh/MocA family oxidoreductase [Acidobacteriota bacterium]